MKFSTALLGSQNLSRLAPFILLAICLVSGLLTFKHYGVSWDEFSSYDYGRQAFSAYSHPAVEPIYTDSDGVLQYYGPAYFITGAALLKTFGWQGYNIRHLFNFITFLIGVAAFYALLARWVSPFATFVASALFASQPLLWGHAFINPKDIPFMSFFLISLVVGFWMVDKAGDSPLWQRVLLPVVSGLILESVLKFKDRW
jgi:hypothetical protein